MNKVKNTLKIIVCFVVVIFFSLYNFFILHNFLWFGFVLLFAASVPIIALISILLDALLVIYCSCFLLKTFSKSRWWSILIFILPIILGLFHLPTKQYSVRTYMRENYSREFKVNNNYKTDDNIYNIISFDDDVSFVVDLTENEDNYEDMKAGKELLKDNYIGSLIKDKHLVVAWVKNNKVSLNLYIDKKNISNIKELPNQLIDIYEHYSQKNKVDMTVYVSSHLGNSNIITEFMLLSYYTDEYKIGNKIKINGNSTTQEIEDKIRKEE